MQEVIAVLRSTCGGIVRHVLPAHDAIGYWRLRAGSGIAAGARLCALPFRHLGVFGFPSNPRKGGVLCHPV